MYFVDNAPAEKVAKTFGYTCRSFTSLVTAFNKALEKETLDTLFFIRHKKGRPVSKKWSQTVAVIIALRQKNFSVEDIKRALDAMEEKISERSIDELLKKRRFFTFAQTKPQRKKAIKQNILVASKRVALSVRKRVFQSGVRRGLMFSCFGVSWWLGWLDRSKPLSTNQDYVLAGLYFIVSSSEVEPYPALSCRWFLVRGSRTRSFCWIASLAQSHLVFFLFPSGDLPNESGFFTKDATFMGNRFSNTVNLNFTTIPYWGGWPPFRKPLIG